MKYTVTGTACGFETDPFALQKHGQAQNRVTACAGMKSNMCSLSAQTNRYRSELLPCICGNPQVPTVSDHCHHLDQNTRFEIPTPMGIPVQVMALQYAVNLRATAGTALLSKDAAHTYTHSRCPCAVSQTASFTTPRQTAQPAQLLNINCTQLNGVPKLSKGARGPYTRTQASKIPEPQPANDTIDSVSNIRHPKNSQWEHG